MTTAQQDLIAELAKAGLLTDEILSQIAANAQKLTEGSAEDKVTTKPAKTRAKGQQRKLYNSEVTETAKGKAANEAIEGERKHTNKRGVEYGRAPFNVPGGAKALHEARIADLDKSIPGISKIANIWSIGETAVMGSDGRPEKIEADLKLPAGFKKMVKKPWTWVRIPGRDTVIGQFKGDALMDRLVMAGYSYSQGNKAWATKSSGHAANGKEYRCRGVGAQGFNNLND